MSGPEDSSAAHTGQAAFEAGQPCPQREEEGTSRLCQVEGHGQCGSGKGQEGIGAVGYRLVIMEHLASDVLVSMKVS